MARGNNVGSVSATIKLDASQMKEEIEKIKKDTKNIQEQSAIMSRDVTNHLNNITKTAENLKNTNKGVSNSFKQTAKEVKNEANALKKLSPEFDKTAKNVDKAVKSNDNLVKSSKNVNKSLKETEKQAKKTASEVQEAFTMAFYDQASARGKSTFKVDKIVNSLKKKFSGLDSKEFEKAFNQALKDTNVSLSKTLFGLGGAKIDISHIRRPIREIAKSTDEATKSTKKLNDELKATETQAKKTYSYLNNKKLSISKIDKGGWDNLVTLRLGFKPLKQDIESTSKALQNVTSTLKTEEAQVKKNTLAYRENMKVRDAMLTQAYGFLSKRARLKDGVLNTIVGQTGGRWVDKGILDEDFRVRMFDAQEFKKYMEKAFKGIIPTDQFKKNLAELQNELSLNNKFLGNFEGIYDYDYDFLKNYVEGSAVSIDELKQSIGEVDSATKQLVEDTEKIAQASDKVITAKKKEAQEFEKFTYEEIRVMQELNSTAGAYVERGETLFPMDYFKNARGHKIWDTQSYTAMRKSAKRNHTIGFDLYRTDDYDDFTKAFQARMKQLLDILNIGISDVVDDEYKKVRSKLSGKMVEYLDFSNLNPELIENNDKWLRKLEHQLFMFERFRKELAKDFGHKDYSYKHNREELKTRIDNNSASTYELYGYSNPFLRDYFKNDEWSGKKFTEIYKQAQRDLDDIRYSIWEIRDASKGLDLLDKQLENVSVSAKKVESPVKQITQETKQLGEATKQTNSQLMTEREILNALGSETYNYLSNLRRGRKAKGVVGTDTALWDRYKGISGRIKLFDYEKYMTHMEKLFKGVISPEEFEKHMTNFRQLYRIAEVLPFEGQGGIRESAWKKLAQFDGVSSVEQLKNKVVELGEAEEVTAEKTREVTNEIKNFQAWNMALANALKFQLQPPLNTFTKDSDRIINDLTRMARANELYTGSAQKMSKALVEINKLKEAKYPFGFENYDLFDARYIRSTLRAVKEARIMPKDKENRKYTGWDKRFLRDFFHFIYASPLNGVTNISPRDLKVPTMKTLNDVLGTSYAYQQKYLLEYDLKGEHNKEDYTKFVKDIQTHIISLLKEFNIELSTELAGTGKRIRVWIEELGKYQNIGSLDISNVIKFESLDELERFLDRATKDTTELSDKIVKLGENADKTAMKTKKLSYALRENVDEMARVNKAIAENQARKLARKTQNQAEREAIRAENIRRANIFQETKLNISDNLKTAVTHANNLANALQQVGVSEDKVVASTEQVKKNVEETSVLYRDIFGKPIFFSNMHGGRPNNAIESIIADVDKRYIDDISNLTSEILGIRNNVEELNTTLTVTVGVSAQVSDEFKHLLTDEENLATETEKVTTELRKVSQTEIDAGKSALGLTENIRRIGDNFRVTFKQMKTDVVEAKSTLDNFANSEEKVVTTTEQLVTAIKQVGKQHNIFGSTGLFSNWGTVNNISVKEFLEEYVAYRKFMKEINQPVGISGYQSTNVAHGLDIIRVKVNELSRAYQQMNQSTQTFGISKYHEFLGDLDRRARQAFERASQLKEPLEKLPVLFEKVSESSKKAGESASESFKKASEESKKFYEEQERNRKRYYNQQKEQWKRQQTEMGEFSLKNAKNIFQQLNMIDARIEELYGKRINSRLLRMPKMTGEYNFVKFGEIIGHSTTALKTFDNTVLQTARDLHTQLYNAMKKIYEQNAISDDPIKLPLDNWKQALSEISAFELRYTALMQRMYNLSRGLGANRNAGKVNTGYGKLLEDMGLLNMEGSLGRIDVVGYSDYVAHINEIKTALSEATPKTDTFKESLLRLSEALKLNENSMTAFVGKSEKAVAMMELMAKTNEQSPNISQLVQRLEHFSGISEKNKQSLKGLTEQAKILQSDFRAVSESFSKGEITAHEYNKVLEHLTQKIKELGVTATEEIRKLSIGEPTNLEKTNAKLQKTNSELQKGKQSLNEFGKAMSKQEDYVNNLYRGLQKARSVIISMKTILRMMGGMAVWNWAFEMVDTVKETYKAKNEMESLLNKNAKINTSGINTFNKALDETVSRFQKINKYNLGEIGASIGLEFNLNAQEMSKSLPIIAMIQSEYVRAGRTIEEANLAVKDILQGEFMRLSRETGIGKKDLMEKYGWNGDNTDVLNLMKALEKAGKERHWDSFAEKATSLNDVLQITQSRFGELGAEIGTVAEPIIVGAFNGILGAVDSLKKGFEGLGSFGKNFVTGLLVPTGLGVAISSYLILAKNVGLLDIATQGLGKSLFTSGLQLNRADVAMHGFWKTLIATSSGIKASELANVSFKKSLAGRILGVDQAIVAEKGLGKAIEEHIFKLRESDNVYKAYKSGLKETVNLEKATIITKDKDAIATLKLGDRVRQLNGIELTRSQRLAGLVTKMDAVELKSLSTAGALRKFATSWKVVRTAILGVTSIALVAWFASMASWLDIVKKNVDGFYNVVDNGKSLIKEATSEWKNSTKAIEDQNEKIRKANEENRDTTALIRERNGLIKDSQTAYRNIGIAQRANAIAQEKSQRLEDQRSRINLAHNTQMAKAFQAIGNNSTEASVFANEYYDEVMTGSYYAERALEIYDTSLTNSTNHAKAHAVALQKQGVDTKALTQYLMDYNVVSMEVAENWRKFNEGDMWAGVYAILGQLKQAWLDFTITPEAQTLFNALKNWLTWLNPHLKTLSYYLQEVGKWGINAFNWLTSTDTGNFVLTVGAISGGLAIVGYKLKGLLDPLKSVWGGLKKLGGKLKDVSEGWKKAGEEAEEAKKKMPESETSDETNLPDTKGKKYGSWGELGADIKQDFMGEARKFAKVAGQIALAMGVISVAIASLLMPALALAGVGILIKGHEAQIQAGIDGIKLLAPTVIALLVPVMALVYITDKYSITSSQMFQAFGRSALGIAIGLGLVAETILMLVPSILALGAVGATYGAYQTQVQQGVQAMKLVSESLQYLLPFVPVLAGGILLGIAIFESGGVGALLTVAVAGGIAIGLGLVAETILMLEMPLWSIGQLGTHFKDLSSVKQGAEAIKLVADAMTDVSVAVGAMALIEWELLAGNIAHIINSFTGVSLGDLTAEGGFFDQLFTFITEFNKLEIVSPVPEKVTALSNVGTGIDTITNAMKSVKTAMDNIPPEFKNNSPNLTYDAETDKTSVNTGDVTGYFDTFKEPLKQLKTFVDDFNNSPEFDFKIGENWSARVEAINQSASMIESLNTAVEKVKTVMQNVGGAGHETAFSTGGALMALGYDIFHMTGLDSINNGQGSGDYVSSLGSSFKQMEDVIKDLFTFQNNISNLTTGGNGENANVDGATAMVTTIQTAISNLATALSNAIPTFEGKGNAISQAIIKGIKDGLSGLPDIPSTVANKMMTTKDVVYNTSNSMGKTTATKFKEGVDPMSEYMTWEISYVKQALTERYDELGNDAYNLGSHIASRFREGDDINSPGLMARSMQEELSYIGQYLNEAMFNLPELAFNLGNLLSSNFNFDLGLSSIQLPNLDMFQQTLSGITPMVDGVRNSVTLSFNTMKANISNAFTGIVTRTQTSMGSMLSATTKNIGAIRTSWAGMQSALIASAENIRSQTSQKINNLKSNMGEFWNKIKHPDQLLSGSAGGRPTGTRPQRRPLRLNTGYAGSAPLFKPMRSPKMPDDFSDQSLLCRLLTGSPCYAGGWNFNWTPKIEKKFDGWNTNFQKYKLDNHLKVGSFKNSNFPVKGKADVFKDFIYEVIRGTTYDYYYDHRYDPAEALRRGSFNCFDGMLLVQALARAFGLGSSQGSGTWGKDGHVWAIVDGIGVIDTTAIQGGYGFTSPKVHGYGSRTIARSSSKPPKEGDTNNYNMTININVNGDDVEVNENKIDKRTGKQLLDILGINPSTGR